MIFSPRRPDADRRRRPLSGLLLLAAATLAMSCGSEPPGVRPAESAGPAHAHSPREAEADASMPGEAGRDASAGKGHSGPRSEAPHEPESSGPLPAESAGPAPPADTPGETERDSSIPLQAAPSAAKGGQSPSPESAGNPDSAVTNSPGLPRNVLLIVVDTLRWDHVGSYGHERDTTPAIDALAEAGVRFDAAYSTAPWTTPSVASILTGLYPSAHGIKTLNDGLSESALTLAEILQGQGFQTGGVISHSLLVDGEGNRFGQGFDIYLEREAKGHNHVSTNGVTEQATRMLEGFAIDGRPFFMFVHYFDPHFNFLRHPEIGYAAPRVGRLDGTQHISEIVDMRASLTPAEIDFLRDLYDEEIAFTDRGIGRLLRALTDSGLDDETAIVLTADHGEEFRERGWIGHTRTLFNELVRVPLVVLDPGARHAGTTVEEPVTLAALTPTVLDLLGIGFDAGQFQADSFAAALRNPDAFESGAAFIEVDFDPLYAKNEIKRAHKKALVLGRHKIVRDDTTGAVAVFDLHADPAETSDLSRTEPELVRLLGNALDRYVKFSSARGVEPSRQTYDEREIELLRGLGYVD